jgi:hypothetical protein
MALTSASAMLTGPSTDNPATGASTPVMGASSAAASAARGEGGGGLHLSGGLAPRRSPPPRPPPTMSSLVSLGGGESLLLAQPVLLVLLLAALSSPDSPLLCACHPLLLRPLRGAGGRPGPGRRWIRSRGVHCHPLLKTTIKTTLTRRKRPRREGRPTHRRGVGEHDE